ncbi:hypothetical protein FRC09_002752 [Ceratobasidium sp. 395]|nr:hypothetical protein FRC09_002752 [Ceratobasidium sp. 395]
MRTYSAIFSLGAAGSALAWPGFSRHANLARAAHETRQAVTPPAAREPVAATWFASWHAKDFPLSNVSWHKVRLDDSWRAEHHFTFGPSSQYTTVTYSFALTTPDVNVVNVTDPDVFKDFVSTAHANNCSAAISVGGWTGSQYFSTAVATTENRTAFVKTLTSLVQENNLDGLDFEQVDIDFVWYSLLIFLSVCSWEYPGLAGIGCNTKSPNDTSNFLAFLQELRTALPNTTFSAATAITPFVGPDQSTPSTNVSEFASLLDYIAIMNYDIWGPWSTSVGPNAPLNDSCVADPTNQVGSAVSAIEAWTSAGIPADQLVLGVAGYGHGFSVSPTDAFTANGTLAAYPPFNKTFTPQGDAWDEAPEAGALDVCGNPEALSGNWDFWGLIAGGFLNGNGTANTAEEIAYRYDECSQTPYVYNKTSNIMVAYDDATSFAAKGSFIKSLGLRGFAMWEAGGDFDDILLDSIRSSAGFPEVDPDEEECEGPTTVAPTATASVPVTVTSSATTPTSSPEPDDECEEE